MTLPHLPKPPADFRARIQALPAERGAAWAALVALAGGDLSALQTNALDAALTRAFPEAPEDLKGALAAPAVRLAVLGSCTLDHLAAGIRVAGLRRGMHVTVWVGEYGQYLHALSAPATGLAGFGANAVLLALDAHHVAAGASAGLDAAGAAAVVAEVTGRIETAWGLARGVVRGPVLQQTVLALHPPVLGGNEHRAPGSAASVVAAVNGALRGMADRAGVHLVAVDAAAGPAYGEMVGQVLGALAGRSGKCLVLDLDNTLWGGVVGDDGVEGIVLGQGSASGEAYVAFQRYARELARRGVILAVCSKNDEGNAREPFATHPDMVLREGDISCFVANWEDKATNLRRIAAALNIGLDSLVFVDDNPMERGLVRRELPMVMVPEVSDDPESFVSALVGGGYFEAVAVTDEDRERTGLYAGNVAREALRESVTDLAGYLRGLEMRLVWRGFDAVGMGRVVQLINKSNQFNLTTRRYSEEDVRAVMGDPTAFGVQLRLVDRFGDNGVIAIVIGRMGADGDCEIDTWLMSCRVLGRGVEAATLGVVAGRARDLGARRLVGVYVPSKKNGMVRDHYAGLGFGVVEVGADGGSRAVLELASYTPAETFIDVVEG